MMDRGIFFYDKVGIKFGGGRYELGLFPEMILKIYEKLKDDNLLEAFLSRYKKTMSLRAKILYKLTSVDVAIRFAEYITEKMGWWKIVEKRKEEGRHIYIVEKENINKEYIEFLFKIISNIFHEIFEKKRINFRISREGMKKWRIDVSVEEC